VKSTIQLHSTQRLRMCGAILPNPLPSWCAHGKPTFSIISINNPTCKCQC